MPELFTYLLFESVITAHLQQKESKQIIVLLRHLTKRIFSNFEIVKDLNRVKSGSVKSTIRIKKNDRTHEYDLKHKK